MTTDYRSLCVELIDALDSGIPAARIRLSPLANRARAALAERPVRPTDEDLWATGDDDFRANYYPTDAIRYARAILARWGNPAPQPPAEGEGPSESDLADLFYRHVGEGSEVGFENAIAEALARWGNHQVSLTSSTQPLTEGNHPAKPDGSPADGEVGELVKKLHRDILDTTSQRWWDLMAFSSTAQRDHLNDITRAADLLQRLSPPQPVPVSERLPGPEDCDVEGRCWFGRSESEDWSADWTLAIPEAVAEFCEFSPRTVWLPFHALPLPKQEASE